jgi:hypothetical protein
MPKWVIEWYQIVTKFMWNGKPPKVKYSAMITSIKDGRLNLQDLSIKINLIKISWIKNNLDKENKFPWKAYIAHHFPANMEDIIPGNMSSILQ